jgi:photosystem II stability/assembly factor-like uncharacterized protein
MKKIILILSLHFAFFASNLTAQWFWQNQTPTSNAILDIHVVDNHIWIVGASGSIFYSPDLGETWITQSSGVIYPLRSVHFIDSLNGWAAGGGFTPPNFVGVILSTKNGGKNWINQPNPSLDELTDVLFVDSLSGFAVGYFGTVLRTTNGGITWTKQNSGILDGLFSLHFTSQSEGWAVGGGMLMPPAGVIVHTTDAGVTWDEVIVSNLRDLREVKFTSSDTGFATGGGGTIIVTTNRGLTWNYQLSNTNRYINGISFFSDSIGWVAGQEGIILHTTDAGINWEQQNSGTLNYLYNIHFISKDIGYAVGENGTILRTTNGGVTFVEEQQIDEMPKEFLLSQNYPNPFNPSTRIQYQVSPANNSQGGAGSISHVSLVVYDILGNEIETLVNEEKSPGTYEVTWNAAGLPSGVYFYQLRATPNGGQTGSFIETRKMILLR